MFLIGFIRSQVFHDTITAAYEDKALSKTIVQTPSESVYAPDDDFDSSVLYLFLLRV